jgi:hypothetical protein
MFAGRRLLGDSNQSAVSGGLRPNGISVDVLVMLAFPLGVRPLEVFYAVFLEVP